MSKLTTGDVDDVRLFVQTVIEAAAPELMKLIAASKPNVAVHAVGELLSVEAVDSPADRHLAECIKALAKPAPARDYRKECWIGVLTASAPEHPTRAIAMADTALTAFDERFPS